MTKGISEKTLNTDRPKDQIVANNYHSVEMKPAKALPIYQFKLYPRSNLNGAFVLIQKNSEILNYLKPGEKIDMKYHPQNTNIPIGHFKTQILNITKKEQGPFKNHFQVGLSIVD
jgi:hypothetical protein